MKNLEIVKKVILQKKITEYFSKHPKAKSAVFSAKSESFRTLWKVTKEGKSFNIVEVNTQKEEFSLSEDDTVAGGRGGKKPFEYDPKAQPNPQNPHRQGGTGTVAAGDEYQKGSAHSIGAAAHAIRNSPLAKSFPDSPAVQGVQHEPWDPNNVDTNSDWQKAVKQHGAYGAMKAMPPDKLKRYFGLSKLPGSSAMPVQGAALVKKGAVTPYGKRNPEDTQDRLPTSKIKVGEALEESSPQFSNISKEFVSAMTPPFDHSKLSKALKSANAAIGQIKDPKERENMGAMIGALTGIVDSTTSGAGQLSIRPPKLNAGMKRAGKVLREDDKKKDKKTHAVPGETADIEIGNQAQTTEQPPEEAPPEVPRPEGTNPEESVRAALQGQTISDASLEIKAGQSTLSLQIATLQNPILLTWRADGSMLFSFRGRTQIFRPSGSTAPAQ